MSGRGDAMVAQRRLDSQLKHERVIAAVDARLAAGHELSIAALARHAGVSRKFIYAHPDLRDRIEQRARQSAETGTSRAVADGRVTIASLRTDAANAKAQNARLRDQVRALEQRLSAMLGRQIASEIDPTGYEPPDQLRAQLERAQAQVFELGNHSQTRGRSSKRCVKSTASCWPRKTAPAGEPVLTPRSAA